jgi:DinB superfamily
MASLNEIELLLSRTPAMLKTLIESLPEHMVYGTEGADTWSPYDVLGHLIHGEKTDWIPRAKTILEFGESRPFDPFDRVAMLQESKGKNVAALLEEFAVLRASSLRAFKEMHLQESDLQKTGTHPSLGRVTMGELLATWVAHDFDHLVQIIRVSAKQYQSAVGPWRQYLSVLG